MRPSWQRLHGVFAGRGRRLQRRARWDRAAIEEGCKLLDRAMRHGRPGPYQLQAAIAACHAQARTADDTDWCEIVLLYERLSKIVPTPVVLLNRAVAVAMVDGPAAGLALLVELEQAEALSGYYLLPATRADFLRRLTRYSEAQTAYREALALAPTDAERRFLHRRLSELAPPTLDAR